MSDSGLLHSAHVRMALPLGELQAVLLEDPLEVLHEVMFDLLGQEQCWRTSNRQGM